MEVDVSEREKLGRGRERGRKQKRRYKPVSLKDRKGRKEKKTLEGKLRRRQRRRQ